MALKGIDHVFYWVHDMDRAVTFYADVVGLKMLHRAGDDWTEFDAGPIRLALHGTDREVPGSGTVVFEVADLDAERWRLEQQGVRFDDYVGEVDGRLRFMTFHDPDGNPVQIFEKLG